MTITTTVEDGQGRVVERTVDNEDGTATRTRYNAAGAVVGTDQLTGLPVTPPAVVNREALLAKAAAALAANSTFLAIASPTNAQTLAQVRLLTRENNAVIRLLTAALDSTADT